MLLQIGTSTQSTSPNGNSVAIVIPVLGSLLLLLCCLIVIAFICKRKKSVHRPTVSERKDSTRYFNYGGESFVAVKYLVSYNKETLASDTLSPTHLTNLAQYIIPEEKIVIEETVGQGYKLHLMKLNVMCSCCV